MIIQHLVRYISLAVLCLTSVVPAAAASSSSPSSASRQETRKVRVGYYHIPGFQQENSAGERYWYCLIRTSMPVPARSVTVCWMSVWP